MAFENIGVLKVKIDGVWKPILPFGTKTVNTDVPTNTFMFANNEPFELADGEYFEFAD